MRHTSRDRRNRKRKQKIKKQLRGTAKRKARQAAASPRPPA